MNHKVINYVSSTIKIYVGNDKIFWRILKLHLSVFANRPTKPVSHPQESSSVSSMSAELFLKKFFKPYQDNIYQSIFTFT